MKRKGSYPACLCWQGPELTGWPSWSRGSPSRHPRPWRFPLGPARGSRLPSPRLSATSGESASGSWARPGLPMDSTAAARGPGIVRCCRAELVSAGKASGSFAQHFPLKTSVPTISISAWPFGFGRRAVCGVAWTRRSFRDRYRPSRLASDPPAWQHGPRGLVQQDVRAHARSNRSRFITLFQAATKSWTNFFPASELP